MGVFVLNQLRKKTTLIALLDVGWFCTKLFLAARTYWALQHLGLADVPLAVLSAQRASQRADPVLTLVRSALSKTEGGTHPLQLLSSGDVLKDSVNLLLDASGPVHYPAETHHSLSQHMQRECAVTTQDLDNPVINICQRTKYPHWSHPTTRALLAVLVVITSICQVVFFSCGGTVDLFVCRIVLQLLDVVQT